MNDPPLYWSVQVHTYFKQTVVRPRSWVGLVIQEREVIRKHIKKKLNLVQACFFNVWPTTRANFFARILSLATNPLSLAEN